MRRLADALAEAARTRSKKAKIAALAGALRAIADDPAARPHLAFATRLMEGRLGAAFERKSLGAGHVLVFEAAARAVGESGDALGARAGRLGDLGDAVGEATAERAGDREGLALARVVRFADELASAKTREAKEALVEAMLGGARPSEARFLVKALLGSPRTGAAEGLLLEAIGAAFGASLEDVRRAFGALPDLGALAEHAAEGKLGALRAEVGRPVAFMLASPLDELEDGPWVVEDKLDGVRAQLHAAGGDARVFARGGDDVTHAFPEVTEAAWALDGTVLDGEIVAIHEDGRPRPFGALQTRLNRKDPSSGAAIVRLFAFDVLVHEGTPLTGEPLSRRREVLESLPLTGAIAVHPAARADELDQAALDAAFEAARERGHEGLVVKRLASRYEPGRRGRAWVKVKKALATLDVVVTAAEGGHGKRAGWLSDVTFAVWREPPEAPERALVDVGKAYTGLTDAEILEMTERLRALGLGSRGHALRVQPVIVLEVAFDGIQRSSRHASGFALRFPRIVRERTDKPPSEANTLEDVERMFGDQVATGHREEDAVVEHAVAPKKTKKRRKGDPAPGQLSLFGDEGGKGDGSG